EGGDGEFLRAPADQRLLEREVAEQLLQRFLRARSESGFRPVPAIGRAEAVPFDRRDEDAIDARRLSEIGQRLLDAVPEAVMWRADQPGGDLLQRQRDP